MDVMKAIYARRAVRSYTAQDLSHGCVDDLICAAVQAPSAMNAQPWAFTATTDRARIREISRQVRSHLLATMKADSPVLPTLLDDKYDVFYGAAALVVLSATSNDGWAAEDCGMAAQNFMLAACSLKLGSCCIGLARSWLELAESKRQLGIPQHHQPVLAIVVGHPCAETSATTPRHAPQIHWLDAVTAG